MDIFSTQRFSTTQALQLFQVMRVGSVMLTSILLAKSGLRTADIGTYEMLLYVGTILTFFWVNGLLQGIPSVYAHADPSDRPALLTNVFFVFCGLAVGLFLLLFLGEKWVVTFLTGQTNVPHFRVFSLFLLFNLPAFSVEYIYLLREKPWYIVSWGVATFGLQVVALIVPVWAGYGLTGSLACLLGLGVLKFIWTGSLVLLYGTLTWRSDLVQRYLQFSAPLIINVFVGNLILLFDNWLVGWYYRDEAVFAVFRYGSRELPLATALATALGMAMIPRLTAAPVAGLAELKVKTRRLMHLVFPLTIALIFCSGWLFPRVFNADFAASAPLFNIYLLITASRVLLPNSILLAKGESRIIFWVGMGELLVKIVLGFVFIEWFGLAGVAWSVVLAFWVEKIGLIWYLRRYYGIKTSDWLDQRWYIGYVFMLVMAFLSV